MTNQFPNQMTEIVCKRVEGQALTLGDVKGALETGIPVDRTSVYWHLIKAGLSTVDWTCVERYIEESVNCKELINV